MSAPPKNPAAVQLPCGHKIPEAQLLSMAASIVSARRVNNTPGTGRPRTIERCACGRFPLNRKPKNHTCA